MYYVMGCPLVVWFDSEPMGVYEVVAGLVF